jgi:hypothetical protein
MIKRTPRRKNLKSLRLKMWMRKRIRKIRKQRK